MSSGLSIDLEFTYLDAEGARHIAEALKSGKCPQGLSINLGFNALGAEGADHIAEALKSGKCPQGLSINLGHNDIAKGDALYIKSVLEEAIQNLSLPYGICINNVSSKVDSMLEEYNANIRKSVDAIKSGTMSEITGLYVDMSRIIASYIEPSLAGPGTFFSQKSNEKLLNQGKHNAYIEEIVEQTPLNAGKCGPHS